MSRKILSLFIAFIPMTTGFLIFANGIFGKMKSIMGILFLCFCLMDLKGEPLMKKIVFEPQPWNELEFNWNEYVWSANRNPCSPDIVVWKKNMVLMNVPNKINASGKGITKIPIPICVFYSCGGFNTPTLAS